MPVLPSIVGMLPTQDDMPLDKVSVHLDDINIMLIGVLQPAGT